MGGMQVWKDPDGFPAVMPGTVQVWRLLVRGEDARPVVLTEAEVERAGQMRPGLAREEFIAGRSLLRTLLGVHLGCASLEVPLAFGPKGKPMLAPGYGDLTFNVAHSHGMVLIALARDADIGIDLEYRMGPLGVEEARELAQANFSSDECRALADVGVDDFLACFYTIWTLKEALVKADGCGLSVALDDFTVLVHATGAQRVWLGERAWWARKIEVASFFAAALAVSPEPLSVECFSIHGNLQSGNPSEVTKR